MQNTISLIIPIYRAGVHLDKCLENIARCSPPPHELILVIDGDKAQFQPESQTLDAKTIRLADPGGPGKARNAGAQVATGDILLFVDSDVIVPEDICERFTGAFATHPGVDAVFGSYDDSPPARDTVSQYKNLLHHYTHQLSSAEAFTFWTGCGAMLRSRFSELGGFSEDYPEPSIEDIELGYRLKRAGGSILLDRSIQVTHLKKWTLGNLVRTDLFCRALPWSRLIIKHGIMNNDMNIDMNSRLSVVFSWLFILFLPCVLLNTLFVYCASISLLIILVLNRGIFAFFLRKRGIFFTVKTLPLHILYYLVSGLAYGLALFSRFAEQLPGRKESKAGPAK